MINAFSRTTFKTIPTPMGTLSGSHGRSFRIRQEKIPEPPPCGKITMMSYPVGNKTFTIRHEKSPVALPSEEVTMTSYPACNKTSLSRKLCIPDKKLLWNAIRKSRSLFRNPSRKNLLKRPLAEKSR